MANSKPENTPSGMSVQDVLFIIFKHKWKVMSLTLAGLGAAAYVYMTHAPIYESDAKLLVRYVLDRNVVDPVDSSSGSGRANDSAISAEVEILTSYDLAMLVAEAAGVDQLAPSAMARASKTAAAAQAVQGGLSVSPRGNVLMVSYRSESPALATTVLQELVNRYFVKHLEVHRSAGAFDFVTQQADQIRGRLTQTEEELKRIKDKVGIISLADSTSGASAEINRIQLALGGAVTERAEQIARLQAIEKSIAGATGSQSTPGQAPTVTVPNSSLAGNAEAQEYQALVTRLAQLRQYELDLLSKYRPENQQVQIARSQISELERRRSTLAGKFPDLVAKAASGIAQQGPDILAERTRLAALEARIGALKTQLQDAQQRAEMLANVAPQIVQLERQKELEETNYRYFAASLEKARVDEALDPSKIPNISVVQKPSTAFRTIGDLRKTLIELAGGGLALGLGLAFLIEVVFDQTIKRSSEFERRLHIPLLLSIPLLRNKPSSRALQLQAGGSDENEGSKALQQTRRTPPVPWGTGHFIRPFAEAIRDRLGLYFELNNLTHKPKLVAVTSFIEGGGTSTIAAGIAAALSEMGEGKVLLVDMNIGRPELHPFFGGKPAYALMTALHPACPIAPAADNLYLATPFDTSNTKQVQLGPKRLYELMPSLKGSSFDYIIFDMPSLDQSSVAMSMAALMDKVLLVTEAEKCGVNMVRRAYQEMTAARANVSCVLNKTRTYGPRLIKAEA